MITRQRAVEIILSYQLYCNNGLCPSCGRPASDPYRKYGIDDANITFEGCISVHHTVNDYWETRPEAKTWRREQLSDVLYNWTKTDLEMLDDIGPERYSEIVNGVKAICTK